MMAPLPPQARSLSPIAYAIHRIGHRFGMGEILFSPGQPLTPVQAERAPRRWAYPMSVNQIWEPRRDMGLTAFDVLRALNQRHVLAALCVRVRGQQLMAIRGGVVAKNKRGQAAEQGTCDAINAFFDAPDGMTARSAWLQQLMRDIMEIDAPTVYFHPNRGGGLAAMEVIDGATIKPILDERGRVALYQQVLYGVALSQYRGRRVAADEEEVIGEYAPGELWYQPYTPVTYSPYGRAPMEDLITLANIFLQKLDYDYKHFTEGNIPAAFGVFDGTTQDVGQVKQFEDNFNAEIQGDTARGAKIRFIPFPLKIERLTELSTGGQYESAFEERNVKVVTATYGVTPSEIGFTADVNRATADSQENVTYRMGIRPVLEWLKVMLFDPTIQRRLRQPQLEWEWEYGESEDREILARVHGLDIQNGVLSPQESRTIRYPDLEGQAPGVVQGTAQPQPMAMIAKAGAPDDDIREALISRLVAVMRAAFAGQGERVMNIIQGSKTVEELRAGLVALWPGEASKLTSQVLPLFDEVVAAGYKTGAQLLTVVADFDAVNEAALKLAKERAAWWASTAAATSEKQIAQVIADWIETGGTMPDLIQRVTAIHDRWVEERSDVGAITEVTRIYARANIQSWKESGLVKGYKVETAADELVCPICRPKRGIERSLDDEAGRPPFHGRCRCWVVPIVKSPGEIFNE